MMGQWRYDGKLTACEVPQLLNKDCKNAELARECARRVPRKMTSVITQLFCCVHLDFKIENGFKILTNC